MARSKTRTQPCNRSDALKRLTQADAFLFASELIVTDDGDHATPDVAASLAVLAGIAAADAACCARLEIRPRGQSHGEAIGLLGTVEPFGAEMAKRLQRLLNRKDESHDGLTFVSSADAGRMVSWARRLFGLAQRTAEA